MQATVNSTGSYKILGLRQRIFVDMMFQKEMTSIHHYHVQTETGKPLEKSDNTFPGNADWLVTFKSILQNEAQEKQWACMLTSPFKTKWIKGGLEVFKRPLLLGRKVMTNLDSILKSRDIYFANKGPSNQSYGFSSSHVWMWELDHKESWALKNWYFWTVGEDSWESLGLQGDPTSPS